MKEKIDYEKIFEDLKDKENYELHDNWLLMIIVLLFFGFGNGEKEKESKTTININLKGSDVNV